MFSVRHSLVKIQNYFVINLVTFGFMSVEQNKIFVRLGSNYGGWWIPKDVLDDKSKNRLMISAGLGFDVTFDQALLDAGFEVIGIDPLEDSIEYAKKILGHYEKFIAINKGLWITSGEKEFFPPKNLLHDSWSATNVQNSPLTSSTKFQVTSLRELINSFSEIKNTDFVMLKMDIEGSEIEVLKDFNTYCLDIDYLGVELDFLSLIPFMSINRRIKAIVTARQILESIESKGFKLIKTENFNFFWIFNDFR